MSDKSSADNLQGIPNHPVSSATTAAGSCEPMAVDNENNPVGLCNPSDVLEGDNVYDYLSQLENSLKKNFENKGFDPDMIPVDSCLLGNLIFKTYGDNVNNNQIDLADKAILDKLQISTIHLPVDMDFVAKTAELQRKKNIKLPGDEGFTHHFIQDPLPPVDIDQTNVSSNIVYNTKQVIIKQEQEGQQNKKTLSRSNSSSKAGNVVLSRGVVKDKTINKVIRSDNHKASERKSRDKVRVAIKDLVLSLPELRESKNPTKAAIIKNATEYIKKIQMEVQDMTQKYTATTHELTGLKKTTICTIEILSYPTHVYMYVDSNWEMLMGYSSDYVNNRVGWNLIDCHACPAMNLAGTKMLSCIQQGLGWQGVVLGQRKDLQTFICQVEMNVVKDSMGNIVQYIVKRKNIHFIAPIDKDSICQTGGIIGYSNQG